MKHLLVNDTELTGQSLTSSISVPKSLHKYFRSTHFFANYDADIKADKSILNIPLLSTVLPLAWLTGFDVHVDELDKTFKESMEALKQVFHKMYPLAPFTTEIIADQLVDNKIGTLDATEHTALLYTGGVDSTYSLINNLHFNPRLIMFWGVDDHPYPENSAQWNHIFSTYSEIADRLGLKFNTVQTNNSDILDDRRISHDFHQYLYDGTLRMRILHTFVLLPLAAPLSISRFDRLIISAGPPRSPDDKRLPSATRPETDEKFIWADLRVKHYGQLGKQAKIDGAIRDNIKKYGLKIKVCIRRLDRPKLNDSSCGKCLRTIGNLILAGVDPNSCGFEVDQSTWKRFRHYLENELEQEQFGSLQNFTRLQDKIPDRIEQDFYGSKEFFNWFKTFDVASKKKDVGFYRDLYYKLPYPFSKMLDELYKKRGIRIHDHSPTPQTKQTR